MDAFQPSPLQSLSTDDLFDMLFAIGVLRLMAMNELAERGGMDDRIQSFSLSPDDVARFDYGWRVLLTTFAHGIERDVQEDVPDGDGESVFDRLLEAREPFIIESGIEKLMDELERDLRDRGIPL